MMIIAFKLVVTPLLILTLTLLIRRLGPFAGGAMMGIPLTTGPISAFTAIEHGIDFATNAASTNLIGQLSTGLFCLAYALSAKRFGPIISAIIGNGVFLSATILWHQFEFSIWDAMAIFAVGLAVLILIFPKSDADPIMKQTPSWELPVRMIVGSIFVVIITASASLLGPQASGLIAPLPVIALVLTVFTHWNDGTAAANNMLRGVVIGSPAFGAFFITIALTLHQLPVSISYIAAAFSSIVIGTLAWFSRLILRKQFI